MFAFLSYLLLNIWQLFYVVNSREYFPVLKLPLILHVEFVVEPGELYGVRHDLLGFGDGDGWFRDGGLREVRLGVCYLYPAEHVCVPRYLLLLEQVWEDSVSVVGRSSPNRVVFFLLLQGKLNRLRENEAL